MFFFVPWKISHRAFVSFLSSSMSSSSKSLMFGRRITNQFFSPTHFLEDFILILASDKFNSEKMFATCFRSLFLIGTIFMLFSIELPFFPPIEILSTIFFTLEHRKGRLSLPLCLLWKLCAKLILIVALAFPFYTTKVFFFLSFKPVRFILRCCNYFGGFFVVTNRTVLFLNRRFGFTWAAVVFFWIWLKTLTNWIMTAYRISKLIKNRYSADGDQWDGLKSSQWRFYYARQRQSETKVNFKLHEATVRLSGGSICILFDFR